MADPPAPGPELPSDHAEHIQLLGLAVVLGSPTAPAVIELPVLMLAELAASSRPGAGCAWR